MNRRRAVYLLLCMFIAYPAVADPLRMIATTTVDGSGLLPHLVGALQKTLNVPVHAATMGSAQALSAAARGDAAILITHDPEREREFVAGHPGSARCELMHNAFIVVGPADDPAGVVGSGDPADAFRRIALQQASFISRDDFSGTHQAERRLWQAAGMDPDQTSHWRRRAGVGMAGALRMADALGAYTLSDPATFAQLGQQLALRSVYADPDNILLLNTYSVLVPAGLSPAEQTLATAAAQWLCGEQGKALIRSYRLSGNQVFSVDVGDASRAKLRYTPTLSERSTTKKE